LAVSLIAPSKAIVGGGSSNIAVGHYRHEEDEEDEQHG
jgi:hypothetical protein